MGIYIDNKATPVGFCLRRFLTHRITELILVVCAAACLLKFLNGISLGRFSWLIVPAGLVLASVLPSALRALKTRQVSLLHRDVACVLGLHLNHWRYSLLLLSLTCLLCFPLLMGLLWLLTALGLALPLIPVIQKGTWLTWILYQFLYVAVAEEIFFRGFILGNLLRIRPSGFSSCPWRWQLITVIVSAALFALIHVFLSENLLSGLTFFPGLILGWLFVRTRSLLAPILFHALANIFYALLPLIMA